MDSIIEECTNNHISLLKVILIILGKDVDLTRNYKIIDLNDIFNKIPSNEIIVDSSKKDRNEEVDDRNIDNKDKVVSKIINNDDEDEEEEDEKV